jgi:hypothetical protein
MTENPEKMTISASAKRQMLAESEANCLLLSPSIKT